MDILTPLQCLQMGTDISKLQSNLADYKLANIDFLTDDQKTSFRISIKSLSDAAGMLIAFSVIIALDEAETSIQNLDTATQQIDDTLKTIANIQKWINIAGASFNLATALLAHNPKDIFTGIKGVVQSVNGEDD